MYYYKEDKTVFLRTSKEKIYIEPDRLDLIGEYGKRSFFPVANKKIYKFKHEDKGVYFRLDVYSDLSIIFVPVKNKLDGMDADGIISIGLSNAIMVYANTFQLVRKVLLKWYPDIEEHEVEDYPGVLSETEIKHVRLTQVLYDLRFDYATEI